MSNILIPDNNHVARHVKGREIEPDGTASAAAFMLRGPKEDKLAEQSLSVNWMERTGMLDRTEQLRTILNILRGKGRIVRKSSGFAVLNVGVSREGVRLRSIDQRELTFVHDPDDGVDDTHAAIHGYSYLENEIATLLALSVEAVTKVSALD
jgi:hypothetical protein